MQKTFTPKPAEIERHWYVVDAAGVPVGRLSSAVARLLLGKHKPIFAPHVDCGDFVVVVNAAKTVLTGNKEREKTYYRTTTRPGSIRAETAEKKRQRLPTRLIESAVFGMLPKGPLGRRIRKKLKVYAGAEHPHQAQQPQPLDLGLAAKA